MRLIRNSMRTVARCWCGRCCRIRRASLWHKDQVAGRVGLAVPPADLLAQRVQVVGQRGRAERLVQQEQWVNLLISLRQNQQRAHHSGQHLRRWRQRLGLWIRLR
jgi:hypothetical protein